MMVSESVMGTPDWRLRSGYLPQDGVEAAAVRGPAVVADDTLAGARAHRAAGRGGVEQGGEGCGEGIGVTDSVKATLAAIADDRVERGDRGADGRQGHRTILEDFQRRPVE